jgi:hypothetical protein
MNKEDFYGTWKVKKCLTKTFDPRLKDVVDGFKSSKYKFDEDGNFELRSINKTKLFLMASDKMEKAKWRFVKKKQAIQIGNKADDYSVVGFKVRQQDGKIIFNLDESDIDFEMKKMK